MKSFLFLLAGATLGAAYLIATQRRTAALQPRIAAPVEDLAHKLQDAWADHHTVA